MGVDYSAKFGIGFEVDPSECHHLVSKDCLTSDESIEDLDEMEIMECLDLPEGIESSYWGNSYSGNHTFFLSAWGGTHSKEQMIEQWDRMEAFAKEHFEGRKVSLIGGGLVW